MQIALASSTVSLCSDLPSRGPTINNARAQRKCFGSPCLLLSNHILNLLELDHFHFFFSHVRS